MGLGVGTSVDPFRSSSLSLEFYAVGRESGNDVYRSVVPLPRWPAPLVVLVRTGTTRIRSMIQNQC